MKILKTTLTTKEADKIIEDLIPSPIAAEGDLNALNRKLAESSFRTKFDNKPEECSVCFNDYDDNQLRPRTLPCGHTFCSQCIDNAIKNGQLTCPSCRAEHAATAATQFPISYAVEALVRKLKNIQLTTQEAVPAKPYEGPARGIKTHKDES
nr:uncharacterized RING finger protein P4H10.07-like [Procambarus clarkii]